MRQSPKLRPNVWDALVAGIVIALAVACGAAVWGQSGEAEHLTAVISVDGAEAERVDLDDAGCAGERTYAGNGYTLAVTFWPEGEKGVQVAHADCPTQDCVHTGTIRRSGQSIVCLPARIIIQLEGGPADGNSYDGPDVVIG